MIYIESTNTKLKSNVDEDISITEQLSFFIPLGMSSLLINITHSLFNAALARLPSPEIYLSAFNVSKSLLRVLQNPVTMIRQMVSALVKDSDSYFKVRKFVLTLVGAIVLLFTLFNFTGASRWVFNNIMGIEGEMLDQAVIILRIFIIFPAAVTLRNFMQGLAIKFRRTPLVTLATIARVAFVALIVFLVDKLTFIPPGTLAGLMFIGAICAEAITMFLGVKIPIRNIPKSLDINKMNSVNVDTQEINNRIIFGFFGPLVVTSFVRSLATPIIDSGLARTQSPEIAISSYAVAWALGIIIVGPLMNFHQVPLNFIEDNNPVHIKAVRKFAIILGASLSVLVGIISFSPIGYYILRNIIGVSETIGLMAVDVLKVMTLLPIFMVTRQFYWGIFMKNRMTKYISNGKIINLIALTISIFIATALKLSNPAVVGVIGKISSEAFEALYLYIISKYKI